MIIFLIFFKYRKEVTSSRSANSRNGVPLPKIRKEKDFSFSLFLALTISDQNPLISSFLRYGHSSYFKYSFIHRISKTEKRKKKGVKILERSRPTFTVDRHRRLLPRNAWIYYRRKRHIELPLYPILNLLPKFDIPLCAASAVYT